MKVQLSANNEEFELDAERIGDGWSVTLPEGQKQSFTARRLEGDILEITTGDRTLRIPFAVVSGETQIAFHGRAYSFSYGSAGPKHSSTKHSSGELTAPMVGIVSNVLVTHGERVEPYQPILVIEAMKVLATLEAPFAGTVRLHAKKGEQVEHGALLAEVVPTDEANTKPTS